MRRWFLTLLCTVLWLGASPHGWAAAGSGVTASATDIMGAEGGLARLAAARFLLDPAVALAAPAASNARGIDVDADMAPAEPAEPAPVTDAEAGAADAAVDAPELFDFGLRPQTLAGRGPPPMVRPDAPLPAPWLEGLKRPPRAAPASGLASRAIAAAAARD